jgi:hypothetical protein
MKKQYNISQITDELSKSVFFQKPAQTGEQEEKNQSALAPKHQRTIAPEFQSAKALSNQPTKDIKQESTKAPEDQNTKAESHSAKAPKEQVIKHLKHFSSYLAPESLKRIKMLATDREQHDYEILQNAVDLYFASLDKTEK